MLTRTSKPCCTVYSNTEDNECIGYPLINMCISNTDSLPTFIYFQNDGRFLQRRRVRKAVLFIYRKKPLSYR
ncbi:unnamed protein product [Acanthoscelides obtectus]|uniref:Uncharacterized protein n=1 Tax=Acanthoscelides obtectus TaxID=200917 RepID=A0A9P0K3T2_ACAOB|nr:unnamed protein product [Acanthoscelides obtectus]CAK1648732.1 hypothetical protein AOBTE_LOCUS15843 [Acanthoscelides obtectus]